METFAIGDTHFGHKNILKYEPEHRPFSTIEEHDEELIKRWNSVVCPKDVVWHLGDVLFGEHSFELLGRLYGNKKLVLGNHDNYPIEKYLKYFTKVVGVGTFNGYVLTHMPLLPSTRYKGNIHGHLHSNVLDSDFHYNVSAEQINLTPIPMHVLLK